MIAATLVICGALGCGSTTEIGSTPQIISVQFDGLRNALTPSIRPPRSFQDIIPGQGPRAPAAPQVVPNLPSQVPVPGLPGGSVASCPLPNPIEVVKQVKDDLNVAEARLRADLREAQSKITQLEKSLQDKLSDMEGKLLEAAAKPFSLIGSELGKAVDRKWDQVRSEIVSRIGPFLAGALLFLLLLLSLVVGLPMRAAMGRRR